MNTTFAILAGGSSSRMGQDKALLSLNGKPLISSILERGRLITDEKIIIANQQENYRFLNIPIYRDCLSMKGPLVGLYTALKNMNRKYLILVGCDMPFVNTSLLSFELQELKHGGYDVVIPEHGDNLEPLHAVYHRETCLSVVLSALENGNRSLIGWQSTVSVRKVGESEIRRFDPDLLCFTNLNTPQEYQNLKQNINTIDEHLCSGD
jgi:molybdopterin-guanine dinucleotide biosynthesis protein A